MSAPKHSPEPWSVVSSGKPDPIYVRARGCTVAEVIPQGADAANARRIVACVNACAGIPTEALEAGAVKEALVYAQTALEQLDLIAAGSHPAGTRCRDALRAALAKVRP